MANIRKIVSQPVVSRPVAPSVPPTTAAVSKPAAPANAGLSAETPNDVLSTLRTTQEKMRVGAEQSLEKGRDMYARALKEAETVNQSLESSFAAARVGLQKLNQQAFEVVKTTTQANLDHAKAVMQTRTPQDFFTLQSDFAKKQMEVFTAQSREMASAFQQIATASSAPLKAMVSRQP